MVEMVRHVNVIFRPSRDSFPARHRIPALKRWAIVFRPPGWGSALHQRLVHGQQDEPSLVAGELLLRISDFGFPVAPP